jgi:putative colanic acid biosynthesis UDP-glucose lipid carrier transferase
MSIGQQHVDDVTPEHLATFGVSHELPAARKWPIGYDSIEFITILSDAATILSASILAGAIYHFQAFGTFGSLSAYVGSAIVVGALFVLWMKSRGMYSPASLLSLRTQLIGVCFVWTSVFFLLAGAVFTLKIGDELSRGANVLFAIFGIVALIVHRPIWRVLLAKGIADRKYSGRKVVLITSDLQLGATGLPHALKKLGFKIERHFTFPASTRALRKREEFISHVISSVRGSDVEEIMVGADPSQWSDLYGLAAGLRVLPFPVSLIPVGPLSDVFMRRSRVLGNKICLELQRGPLSPFECAAKRCIDIAAAGAGLIVLSIVLIAVAIAIKLDSPGPVLFRQRRCGFNGRCFQILKFRTMSVLEDGATIRQVHGADARVTRLGKWLRRTSVDELPQLFNVLAGSMSLVGPRPHAIAHDIEFDKLVRNYAFRHRVKPGLTGWAQVNGCRGSTPTPESIERRVKYDLWYIDNWSFALDLTIMLQTVVEIVRGRNAY